MMIWVDDVRPAPVGYYHCRSVNETIRTIKAFENMVPIELIDLDHDAGDFAKDGGDYIKILDWMEATGRNFPIALHTMNPVGRERMRSIILKNGWKEVLF